MMNDCLLVSVFKVARQKGECFAASTKRRSNIHLLEERRKNDLFQQSKSCEVFNIIIALIELNYFFKDKYLITDALKFFLYQLSSFNNYYSPFSPLC